jgi:exocyst complex protein 7
VAKALAATQETLREFDVPRGLEARLSAPVGADVDGYLADVDKLLDAAAFFEEHADTLTAAEPALRGAQELLSRAMARCEEHLRAHVAAHARDDAAACPPGKEPGGAAGELPPPLPEDALPVLRKLIAQMDAVGYDEYETALVEVRSRALDAALARQGLDKLSAAEAGRLPPEALGERALAWGRVLRWACELWACERATLLDVLLPPEASADAAAAIAARSLEALCALGEAAVATRHGAERLFAFVDVHMAAGVAARPLSKALAGPAGKRLLGRLAALGAAAGDAAAAAFDDFEASVGRDDKRPAGPDGTVHPLTAACMHALRRLFELPQLFDMLAATGEAPPPPPRRGKGDAATPPHVPASEAALEEVGGAALRIIMALHTSLEARARACKAAGLGELFLLNNIHFVARTVRASPLLHDTLGDEWLERQEALIDAHAAGVLAATWGAAAAEVCDTRGLDPNNLSTKDRERVKDKFRIFNEALDALSSSLPHWSVPDAELRTHLRDQLHDAVLPGYEALYDEFAGRRARSVMRVGMRRLVSASRR